jgi:serine/threonine protein kinase
MLTKSGAKLLDFGLAKIKDSVPAIADATSLSTMTQGLTQEGTIIGTLQYMAPEQLEGNEADVRTDIFAFGEVLYEMASGRKAFSGRSQATLISSIMTADPPPLPTRAPGAEVDHMIRRCLAKDPADRWQSVHDLLLELKWASQARPTAAVPFAAAHRRTPFIALCTALALAAAAEGIALVLRPAPDPAHLVRFTIPLPRSTGFNTSGSKSDTIAISPDGHGFVFTATSGGHRVLYYRSMDSSAVQPLADTERALFPFWSPDNRSVGFLRTASSRESILQAGHRKRSVIFPRLEALCPVPGAAMGAFFSAFRVVPYSMYGSQAASRSRRWIWISRGRKNPNVGRNFSPMATTSPISP